MAKVKIQGHASGTGVLTVTAPNTSTDRTITLPDATGTLATTADSVGGATGVDFNDNVKARFGTSDDLEIYHDGSNSIIKDGGYGDLCLRSNDVLLQNEAGTETMLRATPDDRVYLNFNNATKLQTTATGIAVTGGVAIGGTGAANTLDDYEEGTWTPNVGGNATYSHQTGTYTKVGNIVTARATMTINAINSSGQNQIKGLPFASKSGDPFANTVGYYSNLAASPTWIGCYVDANNTTVTFIWNTGNSSTVGANGQNLFQNSARIDINVTYQVP